MFTVVTEQIFKIASMEPGAMLFEASREFEVTKYTDSGCLETL